MKSTEVHETAVIDASACLGTAVVVGPYAVIGAKVEIGDGSELASGAQVMGPTRLGKDNRVFPHACIGFDPQDLKYKGEETRLEIGDENHFREFCTVNRGTGFGGGLTSIGDHNLFMAYSHVAHDCQVGNETIFVNNATLGGHVEVGDFATVGAFASVHQFCRVGAYAYIGGYSVLTRDVLPYMKTVGMKPACYGVNRVGLKRRSLPTESLSALEAAYRLLVRSRLPPNKALARLRAEDNGDEHVARLIAFVASSERGVIMNTPGHGASRGGGVE
jgi:UDP-N-acetylglucosamine acyltransferase